MMEETIKNFPKQFAWEPQIQNAGNLVRKETTIVAGMGGSGWPAEIIQALHPALDIVVQRDYGLSGIPENVLKNSLVIASSYSGNTEEAISAFQRALEKKLPLCVLTSGGKLLELAKANSIPYVEIKRTGVQPRMAKGFMVRGLLKLMGEDELLKETSELTTLLKPEESKERGEDLARKLQGKIPVVYASSANRAIAYVWKIALNETGKIPAFYNVFPELNHNEMAGFDVQEATKDLSERFYFLFLKDADDDKRIQKRMEVLEKLYKDRGLAVEIVLLGRQQALLKIFSSLVLADWVSLHLAKHYGVDPEQVPMVEEFKKLIV